MQGRQQARAQSANDQQLAEQQAMQQQAQIDAMQAQMAAVPAAAAPPAPSGDEDMLTKLAKLGQMNEAGLIDDEEFAAAKAKLLGI
jgi:hypothetical protein